MFIFQVLVNTPLISHYPRRKCNFVHFGRCYTSFASRTQKTVVICWWECVISSLKTSKGNKKIEQREYKYNIRRCLSLPTLTLQYGNLDFEHHVNLRRQTMMCPNFSILRITFMASNWDHGLVNIVTADRKEGKVVQKLFDFIL